MPLTELRSSLRMVCDSNHTPGGAQTTLHGGALPFGTHVLDMTEVSTMSSAESSASRVARPRLALGLLIVLLLLPLSAPGVQRGAEALSCGGAPMASASYKAHDTIAQGPIGPMAEDTDLRLYDGFWLVLPGVNVPVEGRVTAAIGEAGGVIVRWTVGSLAEVAGFNVYRALSEGGSYTRLNDVPLPAQSPGIYEDTTVWPETTFWYDVRIVLTDGTEETLLGSPGFATTGGRLTLALYPARPNPSRGSTTLLFDVPSHAGDARLALYNVRGQLVRTVSGPALSRGRHDWHWDGTDDAGRAISSGVYFVRLEVEGLTQTQKILLVR
jgi:hypothetical protein